MSITSIHLYSTLDYAYNLTATPTKFAELNLVSVSKSDHYIIKNVVGLDADNIIHKYAKTGYQGQDRYDVTLNTRVLTFSIFLNPKYDIGETTDLLRNNLYKMISANKNTAINLRFMQGTNHVYDLFGYITKFESSLFSSSSEVQITFECEDPMFKAPTYTNIISAPLRSDIINVTDNLSNAAHGFKTTITFPSSVTFFKILTLNGVEIDSFFVSAPLSAGSIVEISTEKYNKYVRKYLTVYSTLTSNVFSDQWPMIYPGLNTFKIETNLATNDFTWNSFSHKTTSWGI